MGELEKLIEAVEAGADWISVPASKALPPQQAVWACKAYGHEGQPGTTGSLDAALRLHEALLPGWGWDVGDINGAHIWTGDLEDGDWRVEYIPSEPARSWLLAILRALAKREEG